MRNPHKPFSSWGMLLIMLGMAIVLCLADGWNDIPTDLTGPDTTREVQR